MELSNLRNQLDDVQTTVHQRDATIQEAHDRANAAETATAEVKQELNSLKVSMAFPSEETQAANEDPEALTKRISVLESDLRTAQSALGAASGRANTLQQKTETLLKLHRDAMTASQAKDVELGDLRAQLQKRDKPSHVRDASDFELNDEETETGSLHSRIRALEAENFDLRRGVWRDRRAELQPGIDVDANGGPSPEYEDVDLNGPYHSPTARSRIGSLPRQSSTFQDVISSGISAFTGRPIRGPATSPQAQHNRKQSLGLLSDDGGLDEEAFRLAQEEEAKRRLERVREVKRGLENWRGWRMDLAEVRQNGMAASREYGPVFEV